MSGLANKPSDARHAGARHALARHRERLLNVPGVVGVGAGLRRQRETFTDEPCVTVFVQRKVASDSLPDDRRVPSVLDVANLKIGTDVVELGVVTAPPPALSDDPFARVDETQPVPPFITGLRIEHRPASGGLSCSNARFPVGTLSVALAVPGMPGFRYALSCNHVFGRMGQALPGEPILQPSPLDGGTLSTSRLGVFLRSAPLVFNTGVPQVADASLALCTRNVLPRTEWGVGSNVRFIADQALVQPGDAVCKLGRTTGLTYGRVIAVEGTLLVNYVGLGYPGRVVRYDRQIVTTSMGAYGDSGSLLLNLDGVAVGMLFSGGDGGTVHNPIVDVLQLLGVAWCTHPTSQTSRTVVGVAL
jgi:hypothetical protein